MFPVGQPQRHSSRPMDVGELIEPPIVQRCVTGSTPRRRSRSLTLRCGRPSGSDPSAATLPLPTQDAHGGHRSRDCGPTHQLRQGPSKGAGSLTSEHRGARSRASRYRPASHRTVPRVQFASSQDRSVVHGLCPPGAESQLSGRANSQQKCICLATYWQR
jgi:hypothetical protein